MALPKPSEKVSITPLALLLGEQDRAYIWRALLLAIGVRVGLIVIAYYVAGRIILGYGEDTSLISLIHTTFNRWDTPHYLRIAEHGYQDNELRIMLVFFPLFPLAVRIAHFVIPNYVLAGMVISLVASIVAGYYLQKLVALDSDDGEANRALSYFFLFPSAYVLAVPYTEALFMALVLGSYYAARRRRWGWAGVIGMLACTTRMQGLALVPALTIEAWQAERMDAPRRALWLALVPLGIVIYLALNLWVVGDPLAFLEFQKGSPWFHQSTMPWNWIVDHIRGILSEPAGSARTMIYEMPFAAFILAVVLLLIGARSLRLSYQVFAWCVLLSFMFLTLQYSMLRYILVIFPLFIVLARLGARPALHQAIIAAFVIIMGGIWVLFATEYWGI